MPSDPNRVSVRFSETEMADVERAARVAGVPVGAMVRICAVNWCAFVAAEKAVGRDWGFRRGRNVSADE